MIGKRNSLDSAVPDGLVIEEGRRLLYGTREEDIRRHLSCYTAQRLWESTNYLLKLHPDNTLNFLRQFSEGLFSSRTYM